MNIFFLFFVSALAVHRLTKLVVDDVILDKPRNWLFDRWDPSSTWTYVFTCPWCSSLWLSIGAVVMFYTVPTVWLFIAMVFAISSIVGLIEDRS